VKKRKRGADNADDDPDAVGTTEDLSAAKVIWAANNTFVWGI